MPAGVPAMRVFMCSLDPLVKLRMMNQTELEVLPLGGRAYNGILNAGVTGIPELLCLTRKDLLRVRNLGRTTLKEIENVLAAMGLKLAEP